ncbi:unnamed protein product [Adineta ricciae]|uniref:Centrosomal protein kizuna n=1 Tax=Adineta ricciae TaxID=249248 RepID=A0A813YGP3_ADIRI|nr:unnamed protein product [Adineta ricciae]CAF0916738.1 unnamed protein product [Adineta ricciae]
MKSSTLSSTIADYHKRSARLSSEILKSEEQRVLLDQRLNSLFTIDSRLKQRQQVDDIHSYFNNFNQESERARQRNLQLLNDIHQAEQHLDQLRQDSERLIRLKHDYAQYLESNYPNWQKSQSTISAIVNKDVYDFGRSNTTQTSEKYNLGLPTAYPPTLSSTLQQRIEYSTSSVSNTQHADDQSLSESTSNTLSRSKRPGSLRMELSRSGLFFLLDYIEQELHNTIDKKKFYHHDPPTITQSRTVLDVANGQQQSALKDLDPATVSMVILDQLPSTIRRTTVHQCLLTEDILSLNVIDLDKDAITKILPEKDRNLWTRLIDHFTQLVKFHIMNSQIAANKFATFLSPNNALYLHDKAKSLLKHILEKLVGTQSSTSESDTSSERKQPVEPMIKTTTTSSTPWLNKLVAGGGLHEDDDDDTSTTSTVTKKNVKSSSSTPRTNKNFDDNDLDFYS